MHIHYCLYYILSLSVLDASTFLLIAAPIMERTRNFYGHAAQEHNKCFFGIAVHVTVILWCLFHENMLLDFIACSMKPKHLLWTLYFLQNCQSNRIHVTWMNADSTTVRKVKVFMEIKQKGNNVMIYQQKHNKTKL